MSPIRLQLTINFKHKHAFRDTTVVAFPLYTFNLIFLKNFVYNMVMYSISVELHSQL